MGISGSKDRVAHRLLITGGAYNKGEPDMLNAAIIFFVLGLVAILLGAGNIAGVSLEIGQTLLAVFLILAVVSLVANLITGRKSTSLP